MSDRALPNDEYLLHQIINNHSYDSGVAHLYRYACRYAPSNPFFNISAIEGSFELKLTVCIPASVNSSIFFAMVSINFLLNVPPTHHSRCLHIRTGTKFQTSKLVTREHKGQYHEIIVRYLLPNRYFVAVYCSVTELRHKYSLRIGIFSGLLM